MSFLGWLIILIIILAVIVYGPGAVLAFILANIFWIFGIIIIGIILFIVICVIIALIS